MQQQLKRGYLDTNCCVQPKKKLELSKNILAEEIYILT